MKTKVFIGVMILASLMSVGQNLKSTATNNIKQFLFNQLTLNSQQKAIVSEIAQNQIELKDMLQTQDSITTALQELYKIKEISGRFSDIYRRTVRKIKSLESELADLQYDIESYKEITCNMAYQVYKMELDPKAIRKAKDKAEVKQQLTKSEYFAGRANTIIDKLNEADDDNTLNLLRQANKFAEQAINSQEQALALCYNLELPKQNINQPSAEKLFADNSQNKIEESENQPEINRQSTENNNVSSSQVLASNDSFSDYQPKQIAVTTEKKRIIYRVQIGAFVNEISEDEFVGLRPLSKDDSDQAPFVKYMVGNYTSFKAAEKAKEIIIRNTEYKDAFIVAYDENQRIPLSAALSEDYESAKYLSDKTE